MALDSPEMTEFLAVLATRYGAGGGDINEALGLAPDMRRSYGQ